MWFVWLLRSDIRQGAAVQDAEAQREFVVWWLLWGRKEYPAVWHWDDEHAEVSMQLVSAVPGLSCPRLVRRLYQSRVDLQQAFPLRNDDDLAELLCWYRVHAPSELDAAPELPQSFLTMTESSARDAAVPRIALALTRRLPDLPPHLTGSSTIVADWYREYGRNLLPASPLPCAPAGGLRPRQALVSGGVNIVGFARHQSGLGEDARMAAAALKAANVAHVLIDVPADPKAAPPDDFLADRLRYDITIYCMSAFDTAVLYLATGPTFFAGQYRIGYWPWELPSFPDIWSEAYTLVDEIWTGSDFTTGAYGGNLPVHKLPCPVELPSVKPIPRSELRLHDDAAFVFVYPFDVNSYLPRKNPLGLVRAFRRAFPLRDKGVALLLRVNGNPNGHAQWSPVLREIAGDPRITVLAGTLSRKQALGTVAACDCLVSPHRAEGFGRNIAEAILLGLPVLATAFSGCVDFLAPEEGIPFESITVKPGDYPFGEGQLWADPLIEDMARRMAEIRHAYQTDICVKEQRLQRRRGELTAAYSAGKTGQAFAHRIQQIERDLATRRRGRRT